MGILKGIDKFEREGTTKFKDWAVDAPQEKFQDGFRGGEGKEKES